MHTVANRIAYLRRLTPLVVLVVAPLALADLPRVPSLSDAWNPPAPATIAPERVPSARFGVDLLRSAVPVGFEDGVDTSALLAEDAADLRAFGPRAVRTGVSRNLLYPFSGGATVITALPNGGELATIRVQSPDAEALRLRLEQCDLPDGAELWAYSASEPQYPDGPYTARGPRQRGAFWTGLLRGDTAVLELYTPPGVPADGYFVVADVLHVYRDLENPLATGMVERVGNCHNDVMCYSEWDPLRNATARIDYVRDGSGFLCSGTLLNTIAQDLTPYFLTANHCVATAESSDSAVVTWFWQKSGCNGSLPNFSALPKSAFTDVVRTGTYSDYTLLLVRGPLPGGLTWAGWDVNPVPLLNPMTCVSHPAGSWKRITFGEYIPHPFGSPGQFFGVRWDSGTIEGGSSGSGLYRSDSKLLVGICSHSEVPIGCDNADGPSGFGRLSYVYSIAPQLFDAGPDDEFAGNMSCAAAAPLLDSGTYENLAVLTGRDDWYRIQASPCATSIDVSASFTNSWGNINIELFDGCGGMLLASAASNSNTESLSVPKPAGQAQDYLLRVTLASQLYNTYDLTLNVNPPRPEITSEPGDVLACVGSPVSFSLATNEAVTYQWRRDGAPLTDSAEIQGATTDTLTINAVTPADAAATYDCVVTNSCAMPQTSRAATLALEPTLTITEQPASATIDEDATATLRVAVSEGYLVQSFQWEKDGQALSDDGRIHGATTATLAISPVQAADAGDYRCVIRRVDNPCETISATATLTVNSVTVCPADFDSSGAVDLSDLAVVFGCWGQPCGDLDGNNTTDLGDLAVLLGAWGPCP